MSDRTLDHLQIRTADGKEVCHFPHHSTPIVSVGNGCGPCNYECDETYHKRDGKCVCDAPMFECNGKCASVCNSPWSFEANTRLTPC